MNSITFFQRGEGITLAALAHLCDGELADPAFAERRVDGISSLKEAGPNDAALFDNPNYSGDLESCAAGVVITSRRHFALVPSGLAVIVAKSPQVAFGQIGRALFPEATRPTSIQEAGTISPQAFVHPTARLEAGVTVEPFVTIGPGAEIGEGTILAAGASIGAECRIGRRCFVGQGASLIHALVGNAVVLHPGVRIGQDGFGYSAGPLGLQKMVQIGRVILQDGVEIGANTTVDRGAVRDTVIGENTKIDNLVQVGHNVVIGRNCVIVGQVGISGSATIGDGVAIGGQTGINGHITIGNGAQIAAVSVVATDVPPGARWGGVPARPVREWLREMTAIKNMARSKGKERDDG